MTAVIVVTAERVTETIERVTVTVVTVTVVTVTALTLLLPLPLTMLVDHDK